MARNVSKDVVYLEGERSKLKVDMEYDPEGDVLYMSFGRPRAADDSDVTAQGDIIRLRRNKIVGLTIINFQKRAQAGQVPEIYKVRRA